MEHLVCAIYSAKYQGKIISKTDMVPVLINKFHYIEVWTLFYGTHTHTHARPYTHALKLFRWHYFGCKFCNSQYVLKFEKCAFALNA